ncbi:hypothetical protein [Paenibacillus pseudetheri]|uniref:HAD family hydrolase n=1 Tax=Paenibacillus pseudetheri TaxID=2897682 RepID=A0ABM9BKB8_9BACL|nr:hypothetical protein [Paenibacillus pseudetheri]CAH1059496.1 hypothetical protein PAECIP111894_05705 [Paenibacillus pseudetheri]
MNQYKLLTFDIWDTVLRRNSHPDEVKIKTIIHLKHNYPDLILIDNNELNLFRKRQEAEYQIGQGNLKDGFDDEYDIYIVLKEWLKNILVTPMSDEEIDNVVRDLYQAELQHEIDITYLDPNIVNVLSSYTYSKRLFLSDFYTDSSFINEILKAKGLMGEAGTTSMEHGYNKRSSNLFKKIHEIHGISPSEHFHLGDNEYSDVKQPSSLGINTLHYFNKEEEELRRLHNLRFEKRVNNPSSVLGEMNGNIIRELTLNKTSNAYYDEGVKYSLVFLSYILHVIESAKQKKIEKIFYLTREGVFFKQIHDILAKVHPHGDTLPSTELLEVSRLATFSASLREVSIEEFMRVWNQYSIQSMKALFKTLNVDINGYTHLFSKFHLDVEEPIVYPWQNESVIELFNDSEFVNKLDKDIKSKRAELTTYLENHNIIDGNDVFIVDIGWRGTIQDNLAYLLNHSKITGYYFGLYPFINKQLENTEKHSFFNQNEMTMVRHVAPLEMLCNAAMGSVTGYEIKGENVCVCYDESKKETDVHIKYITHFQRGVLDAVEKWYPIIYNQAWTNRELKDFSRELLRELLTVPSSSLAGAFFRLAHNETFGVGEFVEKKRPFPFKQAFKALVSFEGKKQFVQYLEDSSWPQGLLTYFHLKSLISIYNKKVYFKNENKVD